MNRTALAIAAGVALLTCVTIATAGDDTQAARPTTVVAAEVGAREPQVAVDGHGRIYVAFGVGNSIRCARSDDGGRSYTIATVGEAGVLALGMRRGPRLAATENSVVVTAIVGREGKGRDGDLLAWRSTDAGASWKGPARVNAVEGSAREGLQGMAAGPGGSVFCAWLDLREEGTLVYGSRSRDGGATWEPDKLVYRSPSGSVCQCCHPSVAFGPTGELGVMWRNIVDGDRDLYLARSADDGATFGPAEKLGRGTWRLNACPMDGGAAALGPDGSVETVWMRENAVFAASPGGRERRLGRGVQGWTAFGPNGPYTAWLSARPGKLLILPPGSEEPIAIAEDANDPVVASAPRARAPVFAAWESKSTGIQTLRLDAHSGR